MKGGRDTHEEDLCSSERHNSQFKDANDAIWR